MVITMSFEKLLRSIFGPSHPTMEETDLLFRRKTNRYALKGTISSNKGYLRVARDNKTGRFVSLDK